MKHIEGVEHKVQVSREEKLWAQGGLWGLGRKTRARDGIPGVPGVKARGQ